MAKPRHVIQFGPSATIELIERVRNFAEDVYRALEDEQLGVVENMDSATTEVYLEVPASRHLGRVLTVIKRQLRHHKLDDATIRRDQR